MGKLAQIVFLLCVLVVPDPAGRLVARQPDEGRPRPEPKARTTAPAAAGVTPDGRGEAAATGLEFIDTGFENASPLWYEAGPDGAVQVHLLYDHERSSPNRAAGHFHFRLHARPGCSLTLEFRNLDNVWNGRRASVAGELKAAVISPDGRAWTSVPLQGLAGDRVR